MHPLTLALLAAGVTGLVTALASGPVLRALPEPVGGEGKIAYSALATPAVALAAGAASFGAALCAWSLLPPLLQPQWSVLATLGVLLAAIDLRTTWLPLPLTRIAWAAMAAASLASWLISADHGALIRAAAGAAAAGALYGLTWALTRGGIGFGDVRYAPLIGAAGGAVSWETLFAALLLGSLLGVAAGLARLVRSRSGPYPYAPAMLAGAYLAVALGAFAGWAPST